MSGSDIRRGILKRIEGYVCQDRVGQHGEAEDSFAAIAAIANVVIRRKLKEPLDAVDVGLLLACLKMGRLAHNPRHADSLEDLAGYAVCVRGLVEAEAAADVAHKETQTMAAVGPMPDRPIIAARN